MAEAEAAGLIARAPALPSEPNALILQVRHLHQSREQRDTAAWNALWEQLDPKLGFNPAHPETLQRTHVRFVLP